MPDKTSALCGETTSPGWVCALAAGHHGHHQDASGMPLPPPITLIVRAEHVHVGQRIRRGPYDGVVTAIHWLGPKVGTDSERWLTLRVHSCARRHTSSCGPLRAGELLHVGGECRNGCPTSAEHCAAGERWYFVGETRTAIDSTDDRESESPIVPRDPENGDWTPVPADQASPRSSEVPSEQGPPMSLTAPEQHTLGFHETSPALQEGA